MTCADETKADALSFCLSLGLRVYVQMELAADVTPGA